MKKRLLACFSGGATSAYMTYHLLKEYQDEYEIVVCFANTGMENPETLQFVHDCDTHFGFNTIWLEAVVHHGKKKGCTHRVVTFETASRKGEPFEEVIKKYGIPNHSYIHCTRELKENPIHSYMSSIGWERGEYLTAIGIRTDEAHRAKTTVSKQTGQIRLYPLIYMFPSDKDDVISFFEWTVVALDLPDFKGNCVTCFKKSAKKLQKVYMDNPAAFDWSRRMEKCYGKVGNNKIAGKLVDEPRKFFRGYLDTDSLISTFDLSAEMRADRPEENEGCASSCEAFMSDD